MVTHFKLALVGAAICMMVQYFPTRSTPIEKEPDVIVKIIDEARSDMINKKSFDNVMNAMNQ
jgi:hypothetical protein